MSWYHHDHHVYLQCDEDSLKAAFQTFGEITEVKIPKKAGKTLTSLLFQAPPNMKTVTKHNML